MDDTERLIDRLASAAGPVKPLASPLLRTMLWLALASAVMAILIVAFGAHPRFSQVLANPSSTLEWIASLLTGVLAAYSVFQISVPGRSPSWAWLPLPTAMLWLASIGFGCLHDFGLQGRGAFAFEMESWECAGAITMMSLPLGLVMLVMVRHAGVVRPGPAALLMALSAAAMSAAGVSLIHEGENALMVLFWHAGAVLVLSSLSWVMGRQLFSWIGYAPR